MKIVGRQCSLSLFWSWMIISGLLLPVKIFAQTSPKLIFEKVYLHTDRNVYYPADTLWLKAYLVNAQNGQLINSSHNLYVDLISADDRLIRSGLFRLENGTGHGDIELPDSVAGTFRLRAYTNWMRNFGDNFLFEKEITIISDQTNTTGTKTNSVASPPAKNAHITKPASNISLIPALSFYPEGGSMLQGNPSLVAVKALDASGEGIPASGAILTSKGDTVASFRCDSLGMGMFTLLPLSGEHYYGTINGSKGDRYNVPSALRQGIGIHLRYSDTSILIQILSVNAPLDEAGTKSCMVMIRHTGKTLSSYHVIFQDGQAIINLSLKDLPAGVSAVTVYDAVNKPQCERLVYIQPAVRSNPAISFVKTTDGATGKMTVQIDARQPAQLSVAVTDVDIEGKDQGDIVSYLQLSSELRGKIRSPGRYFDTLNVNRFKQLDLLLMVQGWRDFVWRRIADTSIHISYPAETGITIAGKTYDERTDKPISKANISLFAPGARSNRLLATQADSLGRFLFPDMILYGKQNLKLTSVNDKGEKKGKFLIDTLTSPPVSGTLIRPTAAPIVATDAFPKQDNNHQSRKFLRSRRLKEVKITTNKTLMTRFSNTLTQWGPVQSLIIKPEDEQYKTVEWYLLHNMTGAMQSHEPFLSNGIVPTGVVFPGRDTLGFTLIAPLLFVNGEELDMSENTQAEVYRNLYFYLPINKVKKIELRHMIPAGNAMIDRYILFLTIVDDALIYNPGRLSLDVRGYNDERIFYQPISSAGAEVLGYRPTLLWLPDVKTDASGKATFSLFPTPNNPDLKISVQGVSNSGVPLSQIVNYSVHSVPFR